MSATAYPTDHQRRVRLDLYGGARELERAIDAIDCDGAVKREMRNSLTSLLRLALVLNDGNVSPQTLIDF